MRNIESFFQKMEEILPYDIQKYIMSKIIIEHNIEIIKIQKKLKEKCTKEIIKRCNTCYNDRNFLLYRNQDNQLVFENLTLNNNNQILLYSPNNIPANLIGQQNYNQLLTNATDTTDIVNDTQVTQVTQVTSVTPVNNALIQQYMNSDQNEIVLFDAPDITGSNQRKIKLYIMYI